MQNNTKFAIKLLKWELREKVEIGLRDIHMITRN
jgi:hypothetical protein